MEHSIEHSMENSMEYFDGIFRWNIRWDIPWYISIEHFERSRYLHASEKVDGSHFGGLREVTVQVEDLDASLRFGRAYVSSISAQAQLSQ